MERKICLMCLPQNHRTQNSKVTCILFGPSKARQIMYISSQTVLKNLPDLEFTCPFHPLFFTCGLKKSIEQHVLEKTSKDDLVQLFM